MPGSDTALPLSPPLLSKMLFDHETGPGPSLVYSCDLSRFDPFLESVCIIALSYVDSEFHLLNHYRMRYRRHFLDTLSACDRREASADTDTNLDFATTCNDYTPKAGHIKGVVLTCPTTARRPEITEGSP